MGARWMRNTFIYLLIVVAAVAIVWSILGSKSPSSQTIDISQVITMVRDGEVKSIDISGDNLTVTRNDGSTTYKSRKEPGSDTYTIFHNAGLTDQQLQSVDIKVDSGSKL